MVRNRESLLPGTLSVCIEFESYFAGLHVRRFAAVGLRRRSIAIGDWHPNPHECHKNVDYVYRCYPQLLPVRGWMIMSEDEGGRYWLEAHSVIEDANTLYEISLADQGACDGIRFIRHHGTDEEFFAIVRNCTQTAYPFQSPEEMDWSGRIEEPVNDVD